MKQIKQTLFLFGLIVCTVITGSTCKQNIALGGSVDVLPPGGAITYPDTGDTPIKGSFVLKGTASDDDGVKAVSVVFENIATKERRGPFSASFESGYSVMWTISVNNESTGTEPGHELVKLYPIPDGEYAVILTVTDNNDKTYSTSRNYKIDNTPPVFIVSRPSTVAAESDNPPSADNYGALFSVVGYAGELNTVEKLTVEVPGTDVSMSVEVNRKNINNEITAYSPTNPLYTLQRATPNTPIKGQLFLFDNAREYKGGNAEGEGNKSEGFYLDDNIYTDVTSKGYTEEVISDYLSGKKGSDSDEHNKKIKALRNDPVALAALKNKINKMTEKRSTFKLDPSKSPGFTVVGVKNLPKDGFDINQVSSVLFKNGVETTIFVELMPNKDNTPLVKGHTLAEYKESDIEICLYKWNGSGTESDSLTSGTNLTKISSLKFADLTDTSLISAEGKKLRIKFKLPLSLLEGSYLIRVEGHDLEKTDESHKFEAYDENGSVNNGIYACKFLSTGGGPRVRPSRPTGFKNQNLEILAEVTGLDPAGKVYYNIDSSATPDPTKELVKETAGAKYKADIDISNLSDGEHTIHFLARTSIASEDRDSVTFTVDKTAPTVTLTYPEPTVPQAGTVTVSGTIMDSGAGVDSTKTKYLIIKTADIPTGGVTENTPGWQDMETSTAGSWSFKYNFSTITTPADYGTQNASNPSYYDIPIYILAEDKIGNKTVRKTYKVNPSDTTEKDLKILLNPDGTKPVVKILAPSNGAILGGTIQIFGTTSVAIGSPSDIGEARIQFSKSGNFNDTADGTFGGVDWYDSNNGRVVDNTATSGAVQWTQTINADGAFNPAGNKWAVWFRVKAKNKTTNAFGEWTEKVKIEIDKSSPTIGSPNPIKVTNFTVSPTVSLDYVPRMWIGENMTLTGSLHDESGIKEITISGDLKNGKTYTGTNAINELKTDGWIEEDSDPSHQPSSSASGSAKNYKLKIPLKLDELAQTAKSRNEFTVKIAVVEDKSENLRSEREFTFRFDTKKPSGDFGTNLYVSNGNFTATSINDAQLAAKLGSNFAGVRILAGDVRLSVTGVSGSTVSFMPVDTAIPAGNYNYVAYKPNPLVFAGSGSNWVVRGVANDEGSGIKEVKATLTVGTASQTVTMTELDPSNKITRQVGSLCTWEGKIDLTSIPDGKGTLDYTVTDNSGNTHTATVNDIRVKNKPIKASTITLSTKIGGETMTFGDSFRNRALTGALNDNRDFIGSVTTDKFAFKNKDDSKIKIVFEGGQGTVKYRLKKGDGTTVLQPLTDITSGSEIDLKNHFGTAADKINNSNGVPTKIILELWDQAHGFTQGTDSAFARIDITTLFEALDDKVPTVVVLPFHWNGENDNSLYQNKRTNGHVEIAKINDLGNDYSSVSGKVTLRGFAYDNIKIDTIKAELPGKTLTAARPSSGDWKHGSMASDGAVLTVEKLGADYLGYYVKWTLDWDTEKTSVDLAKEIKITVNDGTNDSSDSKANMPTVAGGVTRARSSSAENAVFAGKNPGQFVVFTNGEKQYLTRLASVDGNKVTLDEAVPIEAKDVFVYGYNANEAKTNVNIVPFITDIETRLMNTDGVFKGAFSRASTGEHPVRTDEKIKIKGFNLAGGTVMLGTTSLGTTLNNVSIASSHTSDEISVQVGSRKSINNMADVSKPYNIEANGVNNDILTVKRKLFIWETKTLINNAALESPQFVMDKNSKYYMSYGNLKSMGSGSNAMRLSSLIDGTQNNEWERCYSKYHNTVIAYDDSGNPYLGATNTDRSNQTTAFTLFFQTSEGSSAYSTSNNKRRLENCDNELRSVYDVNRVQIPKMAVRGGGTSANPAKLAVVYFDKNVVDDAPIKYRYGTVESESDITDGISHNVSPSGGSAEPINSGSAKGYEIIANKSSTYKGGQYAAVGLTSTNRAVVVWYDASHSQLIYSYRDMGTGSYTEPTDSDRFTSQWQDHAVVIDSGAPLYVDLVVDDQDGVHIGYYSGSNNGVRYAYLAPSKVTGTAKPDTSDFKIATVDTYMNPGSYLKIGVRKENNKQVPYISYYHNGFFGSANAARMAWLKDGIASATDVKDGVENGKFTGNWVVMTVPATEGIQQYTICHGVPISGQYANKVIAAYFTNANYEMAVLKK